MKRKIKKFSEGGTNIRTRTDAEFAEDSKHGGYGRYMPKTKEYTLDEAKEKISGLFGGKSKAKEEVPIEERSKPVEERPTSSGVEDYASLGKRFGAMPAKSTMSGPIEDIKPEKVETPKAKAEGPFSRGADPDFESNREVKRGSGTSTTGDKDSGGGSKGSGTKAKKAKRPSNPDAPAYDKTGNERRSGDSQSFAPPPRSGMGPKNTFLTKDRSDAAKKSMSKGFSMGLFERGDLGIGKKKGGAVKSASARADGIAIRGKTRA
jgi:hypothetical protein